MSERITRTLLHIALHSVVTAHTLRRHYHFQTAPVVPRALQRRANYPIQIEIRQCTPSHHNELVCGPLVSGSERDRKGSDSTAEHDENCVH